MNVIQRVAFTWVVAWVLMESFMPSAEHEQKLLVSALATISIAYLYDLHGIIYRKIKSYFSK